ncbi:MAG: hypothetical protein M1836_007116 [Candelina mexicana]|nr:MAG: hypothetical protein M1836_007116 [Candelina mexicana]
MAPRNRTQQKEAFSTSVEHPCDNAKRLRLTMPRHLLYSIPSSPLRTESQPKGAGKTIKDPLASQPYTYHEYVYFRINWLRDRNAPVQRVQIDEDYLTRLETAEETNQINTEQRKAYTKAMKKTREEEWWSEVLKDKYNLHEERILSLDQIQAAETEANDAKEAALEAKADAYVRERELERASFAVSNLISEDYHERFPRARRVR